MHSSWENVIDIDEYLKIISKFDFEKTLPPKNDVLNFAKYNLNDVRVVILGLAPYHEPGEAHGIAFSTLKKKTPKSLFNIYKALTNSGLLEKIPDTNLLENWCIQGICLLNTSLTTEIGEPNAHGEAWKKFMKKTIENMCKSRKLTFLLWGKEAKSYNYLEEKYDVEVLEWCHPVARGKSEDTFPACPHFKTLSKMYRFNWNPDIRSEIWYTDGSAKNNQSKTCRAGYGAYSPTLEVEISGVVETVEVEGKTLRPTNIRAEGIAILNVLYYSHTRNNNILIKTDSQFWIDMIYNYIPKWVEKKNFGWNDKANADICESIWYYYHKCNVILQYVKAHHDYSPNESQKDDHHGNKTAERLAESAILK